jgi:hypothetical protein
VQARHKHTSVLLTEADWRQLASFQAGPVLTDVLESFKTWCSKPPKGFEKFYKDKPAAKKDGAAETKTEAAPKATRQKPKADTPKERVEPPKRKETKAENDLSELFRKSFGGGASGGGGPSDSDKQRMAQLLGLGLVTVLGLGALSQSR